MDKNRKLYRSVSNKKISGVCGGIAEYFGIDATIVRVIYILIAFFTAFIPCTILYFIFALVIPTPPMKSSDSSEASPQNQANHPSNDLITNTSRRCA